MGREIRKVPPDWEHPKDERGRFIPLYDSTIKMEAETWIANCLLWSRGEHPDQADPETKADYPYFWMWSGNPPDPDSYRTRDWTEDEATHFQVYETVSEGTPVSPVLKSREAVEKWCISQGYSESAARNFARDGWAPSMAFSQTTGMLRDIESRRDS